MIRAACLLSQRSKSTGVCLLLARKGPAGPVFGCPLIRVSGAAKNAVDAAAGCAGPPRRARRQGRRGVDASRGELSCEARPEWTRLASVNQNLSAWIEQHPTH